MRETRLGFLKQQMLLSQNFKIYFQSCNTGTKNDGFETLKNLDSPRLITLKLTILGTIKDKKSTFKPNAAKNR